MPRISRFFGITIGMVLFLAVADTCVFAADPNPESILGKWLVTQVGKHDATKLSAQIEWEFTKDEVIVRDLTNAQEISRNQYVIDASQNPKWITVTIVDKEKEIRNGIFEIVGEELHLKQTVRGGPRPTSFPKDDFVIMKRNLNKKANQIGRVNCRTASLLNAASRQPSGRCRQSGCVFFHWSVTD